MSKQTDAADCRLLTSHTVRQIRTSSSQHKTHKDKHTVNRNMVVIDMVTGSTLRFDDQTIRHGHSVCLLDVSGTPNDLLSTGKVNLPKGQNWTSDTFPTDKPWITHIGCQLASLDAAKEIAAAVAAVSSEPNGIFALKEEQRTAQLSSTHNTFSFCS